MVTMWKPAPSFEIIFTERNKKYTICNEIGNWNNDL